MYCTIYICLCACVCMSWAQETVSQCSLQHSNGLAKRQMLKAHKHVSIACGSTSNATTTPQRPFSIKIWLQTALRSPRDRLSYAKLDCGAHVAQKPAMMQLRNSRRSSTIDWHFYTWYRLQEPAGKELESQVFVRRAQNLSFPTLLAITLRRPQWFAALSLMSSYRPRILRPLIAWFRLVHHIGERETLKRSIGIKNLLEWPCWFHWTKVRNTVILHFGLHHS